MPTLSDTALAYAVAAAALEGDAATCERLLALADADPDDESEWFRDDPEDAMKDDDLPWGDELPDDSDLPWGEELPDVDADLPIAAELSETEAYIYGGGVVFATSSAIDEWRYFGDTKELYFRFKGTKASGWKGRVYRSDGVPFSVALAWFKSDSPGRFFNWHIKGKYPTGAKLGLMPSARGRNVVTTLD
jgi:hypothetical protein